MLPFKKDTNPRFLSSIGQPSYLFRVRLIKVIPRSHHAYQCIIVCVSQKNVCWPQRDVLLQNMINTWDEQSSLKESKSVCSQLCDYLCLLKILNAATMFSTRTTQFVTRKNTKSFFLLLVSFLYLYF